MMIQTPILVGLIVTAAALGTAIGILIGFGICERMPESKHFYKCDRCGRIIHGYKSKAILPRGFADKRRVHLCYSCQSDIEEGKPYQMDKGEKP